MEIKVTIDVADRVYDLLSNLSNVIGSVKKAEEVKAEVVVEKKKETSKKAKKVEEVLPEATDSPVEAVQVVEEVKPEKVVEVEVFEAPKVSNVTLDDLRKALIKAKLANKDLKLVKNWLTEFHKATALEELPKDKYQEALDYINAL